MSARRTTSRQRAKRLRLKGALHAHTRASDGSLEPAALAVLYRELGYDFVFLTDHNKVTHAGGTKDFLVLPGIEVGVATNPPDRYWHFVGLCPEEGKVPGKPSPEALYDFIRAKSPFCVLAHPYWSQLTGKDLLRFEGLACIEVYNAGCELEIARGHSEYAWDGALAAGRRLNAVAVDDCHGFDDVGRAWVTVDADAFTADAVLDALSRGTFHSSCGPEIRSLRRRGGVVEVEVSPCRSVAFLADRQCGRHVVAGPDASLTRATYALQGKERYVRVECVDAEGRKAWSNPLYFEPAKPAGA